MRSFVSIMLIACSAVASDIDIMMDDDSIEEPEKPKLYWLSMRDIVHDALPFINIYREYVADRIKFAKKNENYDFMYETDPCCLMCDKRFDTDPVEEIEELEGHYDELDKFYHSYARISLLNPEQRRKGLLKVATYLKEHHLLSHEHEEELTACGILRKPWYNRIGDKIVSCFAP